MREENDTISRAELIRKLEAWDYKVNGIPNYAWKVIRELPPINPQKTGYWIVEGAVDCYLEKVRCHCSECWKKKQFPADYDPVKRELSISYKNPDFIDNYCPNCGAKMEVKE